MEKLLNFMKNYCNGTYFLERNMCLISRPDKQEKKHLAGYSGWMSGKHYYFILPDVLNKVFNLEEIKHMTDTGLIELTKYDFFDRLRNVEVYCLLCSPTESRGSEATGAS